MCKQLSHRFAGAYMQTDQSFNVQLIQIGRTPFELHKMGRLTEVFATCLSHNFPFLLSKFESFIVN